MASLLSEAKNQIDVAMAWRHCLKGNNPELCAIISLPVYNKELLQQKRIRTNSAYNKYLVPYFSSEKLFFIDDEIVNTILEHGEAKILVDHTISFDTNFAGYINSVVRGEKIKGGNQNDHGLEHQNKIIKILDNLIYDDLNFDHFFYLIENIKFVYPALSKTNTATSPIKFWNMLDKKFRKNIVSLELFRGIDCQQYRKTRSPQSVFTFRQAVKNVIKSTHAQFLSHLGIRGVNVLLRMQRLSLLYLIGTYKIEFSPEKDLKIKTEIFFNYIQNTIGYYSDRDTLMAFKYFQNRKNVPLLKKVNNGRLPKKLFERLNNIAWDMTVPKILDLLITGWATKCHFLAPFFLTFDADLGDLLRMHQVKCILIDRSKSRTMPFTEINTQDYYIQNGCKDIIVDFFSKEKTASRMNAEPPPLTEVDRLISKEFLSLKQIMKYGR